MAKKGGINMNLVWNVYMDDPNKKSIELFNIFDHGRFTDDVRKSLNKCDTKEELAESLRKNLLYYYWSKAEWEIVITPWVPSIGMAELDRLNAEREETRKKYNREPYSLYVNPDICEKVDVYSQVMLNWDVFVDYVWSHKKSKRGKK